MISRIQRHVGQLAILIMIGYLYSCKNDVDLTNIDKHMQAEMGLAMPVGTMQYTANDLFQAGTIPHIYLDETGIFHFIDTVKMKQKEYHKIDLSQYVGESTKNFNVYSELDKNGYLNHDGTLKTYDTPIELKFPLTLKLNGMNTNPDNERIDSVQVINAVLTSVINVVNLGMQWNWINSVDVVLNDQFRRPEGNIVRVYDIEKGGHSDFGENIPIQIANFTVSLMKDPAQDPSKDNVVDSCGFTFLFNFTVPSSAQPLTIASNAAFNYRFQTQFIDFTAAWGYFQASNQMRDRDIINIEELWSGWKEIKKMKLRFLEPAITVFSNYRVAAPLRMYVDSLIAVSNTATVSATWDGVDHTDFLMENVLGPYTPLTDSVWNWHLFDYQASNGRLDKLFDIRPNSLIYSYHLQVDDSHPDYIWKQHRVTPDTRVNGYGVVDMPFKLNAESEVELATKIENVHFERIKLDSILREVKVIEKSNAKHIKLYMQLRNSMPFDVDASVFFLRQDSSVMNLSLFEGLEDNRITLPAPQMARNEGEKYGYVVEPSVTTWIVDVDQQQFDSLAQCKHLKVDAFMGNNPEPCKIDTNTCMHISVGVAATVEAIMNLNKNK